MLRRLGWNFRVISPDIDESPDPGETPAAFARRAAMDKAHFLVNQHAFSQAVIITADTVVTIDGQILGKPADPPDAEYMLHLLNDRTHHVLTGFCLLECKDGQVRRRYDKTVSTEVTFRKLHASEISAYIAGGEPFDKAGAYAIQEGAAHMVSRINGSYTNVVGLPLAELSEAMFDVFGYRNE
jgi:septum formation protein